MVSDFMTSVQFSRRTLLMVGAGAATAALLSGCVGGRRQEDPTAAKVLRLGATSGPISLDPALQNLDPVNLWFVNLAYEPLIRMDSRTGEPTPALATEWRYVDPTTFRLRIREGVVFHDGEPVTTQAVVDSLDYVRQSGVNANWIEAVKTVRAVDDTTVELLLDSPNDALPMLLSQRLLLGSVISPAGVGDPDTLRNASHGAGPYVLDKKRTVSNDVYVYTPNERYWDPSKIKWDSVEIKVVANDAAALQAVKGGGMDLVRADAMTAMAAEQASLAIADAPFAIYGVNFLDREGTVAPELGDVRVRRALSYAIDRPGIAHAVYGAFATPTATITLPDFLGYSASDAAEFAYDPDRARTLLAEAGYASGLRLTMATTTLGDAQKMAQAVVENWRQVGVGINLVTFEDEGQMISEVTSGKYPMAVYSYGALPMYIQARSFFTGGRTQFNALDSRDPQMEKWLAAAAKAESDEERGEYYAKVLHRATVDLAWMANVFAASFPMVYRAQRLEGVAVNGTTPSPDVATSVAPAGTR